MVSRRQALISISTAAAATAIPQGALAKKKPGAAGPALKKPKAVSVAPLPFKAGSLPGLPEPLIRSHHDNNYAGAVKKLNRVRRELGALPADTPAFVVGALKAKELAFANSVTLHELYFGNLGGHGQKAKGKVRAALEEWFGGFAKFEEQFRTLGGALGGGSGWVILGVDLHTGGLTLSPSSSHSEGRAASLPLLVLDMYEHSYHMTYGTDAGAYVDAFWKNINWREVGRRFARARSL